MDFLLQPDKLRHMQLGVGWQGGEKMDRNGVINFEDMVGRTCY